jgi:hypothetical protein
VNSVGKSVYYSGVSDGATRATAPAPIPNRTTPASASLERKSPAEIRASVLATIVGTDETVIGSEQSGNAKRLTETMLAYRSRMKILRGLAPGEPRDIEREFELTWRLLSNAATQLADYRAELTDSKLIQLNEQFVVSVGDTIRQALEKATTDFRETDPKIAIATPGDLINYKEALFSFLYNVTEAIKGEANLLPTQRTLTSPQVFG